MSRRFYVPCVLFLPKADHIEYLRVYMRQLRKKLEAGPERLQYILTELGNNSSSRRRQRRIQRRFRR